MNLFNAIIQEIRKTIQQLTTFHGITTSLYDPNYDWPTTNGDTLLLKSNTAMELGSPDKPSLSFILPILDISSGHKSKISLIGKDITSIKDKSLSFGKIVFLQMKPSTEKEFVEHYQHLVLQRFDLQLKDYMLKAAPHYLREWSRIGYFALQQGFSYFTLGNALIKLYKSNPWVQSVEILFISNLDEAILSLYPYGERVLEVVQVLKKRNYESFKECTDCEYKEICDQIK